MAYIPLDKPMEEILVDMVNSANGTNHTVGMLDFGQPVADPGDDPQGTRNTKITLTAIAGSGYAGSVDVWYNRLYASSFFEQASLDAGGDGVVRLDPSAVGSGITLHQAIALLEAKYGISIDKSGIDATTVVQPVNDVLTFTLPSQNLMWVQSTFEVLVEVLGTEMETIFPDELEPFADLDPVVCSWLFVDEGTEPNGNPAGGRPTMTELTIPTDTVDVNASSLPGLTENNCFKVISTETKATVPGMVFGFDLENEEIDARDENTYNFTNAVQHINSIFEVVTETDSGSGPEYKGVTVGLNRNFWRQTENAPFDWQWGVSVLHGEGMLNSLSASIEADVGMGNAPALITARVEVKVVNTTHIRVVVKETVTNTTVYDGELDVGDTSALRINHIARNWVEFV